MVCEGARRNDLNEIKKNAEKLLALAEKSLSTVSDIDEETQIKEARNLRYTTAKLARALDDYCSNIGVPVGQILAGNEDKMEFEKEYSIRENLDKSVVICMPLLPTKQKNDRTLSTGFVAHNVKKMVEYYCESRGIYPPYFEKNTLEYVMNFGPETENRWARDLDNVYSKDITDCLLGLMFSKDDYLHIPELKYVGRRTDEPSFTQLIIRPSL